MIIKSKHDNKNNNEHQDLRGNPIQEKTMDGDKHKQSTMSRKSTNDHNQ